MSYASLSFPRKELWNGREWFVTQGFNYSPRHFACFLLHYHSNVVFVAVTDLKCVRVEMSTFDVTLSREPEISQCDLRVTMATVRARGEERVHSRGGGSGGGGEGALPPGNHSLVRGSCSKRREQVYFYTFLQDLVL